MNDDDFLLDEEEDVENNFILPSDYDEDDSNGDDVDLDDDSPIDIKVDSGNYGNGLTENEVKMSSLYSFIKESDRKDRDRASFGGSGPAFPMNLVNAIKSCLSADPKNTAEMTISYQMKEILHLQAHNRIPASVYSPESSLRGSDMGDDYGNIDDGGFNEQFAKEIKECIADFVDYLANRDLSKDSAVSRKKKKRQLPAFIIFLFSSGMYDFIINCPTMPPEYDKQIRRAFNRIQQRKFDVIEELAEKYEEAKRPEVAERVRKLGVAWFDLEPNELTGRKGLADLNITIDDVLIYKSMRSKYTNVSKTITQDVISDMIEVVMDEKAGIYEKLKDKTKSDAISDVKQVFKEWMENNGKDSRLADKIIWKDI